jgi:hypothetical protein
LATREATDVTGHLAPACGVADQDHVFQIERFDELREVVGIGVHPVASPGLARTAMTATVMCDGAKAVGRHEDRLVVPGVCIAVGGNDSGTDRRKPQDPAASDVGLPAEAGFTQHEHRPEKRG